MGKMKDRGVPYILLFMLYREGISHYGGRRDLSLNKV